MPAAPHPGTLHRASALLVGAVLAAWGIAGLEGLGLRLAGQARAPADWLHALLLYGWFAIAAAGLIALVAAPFDRLRPGLIEKGLVPTLGCGLAVIVAGMWWNLSPSVPPFASATGLALNAVLALTGLGVLALVLRRRLRSTERHAPSRRRAATGLLVLLFLAAALALRVVPTWIDPGSAPAVGRPPVLVIAVDTLRRDHLGCYGYARDTSPRIDGLAADGIVFDTATTTGNFTVPSMASFLTGEYPSDHGVIGYHDRIDPDHETLAERFRRAGYRTGAFVANPILRPASGFARGFDRFEPTPVPDWVEGRTTALERVAVRLREHLAPGRAGDFVPAALDWIRTPSSRPPFAWVHLLEPHSPYAPPPELARRFLDDPGAARSMDPPNVWEYRDRDRWENFEDFEDFPGVDAATRREMVGLYDAEIRHVDAWVGRLLDALRETGLYDRALIVLLSDHGEEFDDHDGWFHGLTLYEEMVGMPLIVKMPGQRGGGTRSARSVDMVDLAATISTATGLDHGFGGEDHGAALGRGDEPPPVRAFVERPPHLYGLRRGDWKLVRRMRAGGPEDRLFDLDRDPGERIDLATVEPDTLQALRADLDAILGRMGTVPEGEVADGVDPATRDALRTLGYTQ